MQTNTNLLLQKVIEALNTYKSLLQDHGYSSS